MTTWTRTLPEQLAKAGLDDLRVHLEAALNALGSVLSLLPDLADTRQAGTGYITADGRQAQAQAIRKEREARYPTKGIGVGLRGLYRSDCPVTMPGQRPVPVNLPAVSVEAEIPMALIHLNSKIRRDLESVGVCPLVKPAGGRDRQGRRVTQYPSLGEIFRETRLLTRYIASPRLLLHAVRTLEDLADRASTVVYGSNRMPGDAPCPHCGRYTLVGYVEEGVVRCEPPKGQRCYCADSYCPCRTRRDHRHEWTRTPPAYLQGSERKRWRSHTQSLEGLSRAIANAAATRQQQGAPTVPEHLHHIEVDVESPGTIRFRCDGAATDPCHVFPDCDCETWSADHATLQGEHVPVEHADTCWMLLWLEGLGYEDALEVYAGEPPRRPHPEGATEVAPLRSGPVDLEWDGDVVTWKYAVDEAVQA